MAVTIHAPSAFHLRATFTSDFDGQLIAFANAFNVRQSILSATA
jgi:hypothetical protein